MKSQKRKISAGEFVRDIRLGMTTSQLMTKYQLSPKQCQSLFHQLETSMPDPASLYQRSPSADDDSPQANRLMPRHDVPLPLSVYDIKRPEEKGLVLDVSEKGLRIQGVEAKPMQISAYVILSDEMFDIRAIFMDAQCRWVKRQGLYGRDIAGFQMTDISKRNLEDLHELMQKIILINRGTRPSTQYADIGTTSPHHATTRIAWICPACEMPQNRVFSECPQCGIIVSKYLEQVDSIRHDLRRSFEGTDRITKKVSVPSEIWNQIESPDTETSDVVTNALDFYLKSKSLTNSRSSKGRGVCSQATSQSQKPLSLMSGHM
jgi:hypothetical protein